MSNHAAQAEEASAIAAQPPKCESHITIEPDFTTGNRCPRRMMSGVASPHGSHESIEVRNSFAHAWCIPSERITNTVRIASTRPKPSQVDAIQIHRGERDGLR